MKSFGKYISKHLASFAALMLAMFFVNIMAFGWTFYGIMANDYGDSSPQNMLENLSASVSLKGISDEVAMKLKNSHIWAIYLDEEGYTAWEVDAPVEIPERFTIRDVAVFAKGYLAGYPVFIRNMADGMLVLGYPRDSYTKLTGNYIPTRSIQLLPYFVAGMSVADLVILFLAYFLSKRKIMKNTAPIISSIETLGSGEPVSLSVRGELSGIANSVNKAAYILSHQNQARANWISGVSHDIRTPLSMIMGYAEHISQAQDADSRIREEAETICIQSNKIKELVNDLNLVSQLEYEMQPLHKTTVRLSGLIRSYTADLLNIGIPETYTVRTDIASDADHIALECDKRLILRALANLVQNSIHHNPNGCDITLSLDATENAVILTVSDNGIGLSEEKLQELKEKPHYMNSTDERLDLRHGLGLILVGEVVKSHGGSMQIDSKPGCGYKTILSFPMALSHTN